MTCSPRFVKICDIINVSNCETEAFSGHNGIGTCDPSAIPVQCSKQLGYEATTGRAGHFSGSISNTFNSTISSVILAQRSYQLSYETTTGRAGRFSGSINNTFNIKITSVISVQCSYQLRYEDTTRSAGHFTGSINVTICPNLSL